MTEENNSENQEKSVEELIKEYRTEAQELKTEAKELKEKAEQLSQKADDVETKAKNVEIRCKQGEEDLLTIKHQISGHKSSLEKNNLGIKLIKKNQGLGKKLKKAAVIAALATFVYFGGNYVKDKLSTTAQKSKIATSQAAKEKENITGNLYEKVEGKLYEEGAGGKLHGEKIGGRLYEDTEGKLYKEKSAEDKKSITKEKLEGMLYDEKSSEDKNNTTKKDYKTKENLEGVLYYGESRRAKKENLEITLTAAQEKTIKKIRAYNSSEEKRKAISEMIQNYKQGDAPLFAELYHIFAHKGNGNCKNREALIRKLAEVRDPEVIYTLKDALKDEDYIIPVIAAEALAKNYGDDSGKEIAEKIVNNPVEYKNNPDIVNSAINTIRLLEKGMKK